jgi:hypothetical protein
MQIIDSLIRQHNKIIDIDFTRNTLSIMSKSIGTALVTLDAKNNKDGIISTSITVQVDTPLSIIDQDLKTVSVKTDPNTTGQVTFVSISTAIPQDIKLKTHDIYRRIIPKSLEKRNTLGENATTLD